QSQTGRRTGRQSRAGGKSLGQSRFATRSAATLHGQRRPQLEIKVADIIGLYLRPPAHAAVFCVDEKTAIQALDRVDPVLPLSGGGAEKPGFEDDGHGTLPLYAARDIHTGVVHGKTADRHTSAEFVGFLNEVVAGVVPDKDIYIIADNLSAHKTEAVKAFLEANPRVKIHYTPTYSSWLNPVEIPPHLPPALHLQTRPSPQDHAPHKAVQHSCHPF